MSKQIIIESTNEKDTPADIENTLEKAYTSIVIQREKKEFQDRYLREKKLKADKIVKKVFQNMIEEIADVLS